MQTWLAALRPRTLPAGATPIIVGAALAWRLGVFEVLPAVAALLVALLIQIGTNLANDYYDFKKGADTPDRAGPRRASATGDLEPTAVRNAAFLSFGLAMLVGLYLVAIGGWPVLLTGAAAVLSGLWYTAGPKATGYTGLADLFCLAFFGPVAVMGTLYVQNAWSQSWSVAWDTFWDTMWMPALLWGLAIGALSVAILAVNNLRDIPTDAAAGKKTLAVRFGAGFVRAEYAVAVLGAYAISLLAALRHKDLLLALPLMSLFLALPILRVVMTDFDDRRAYNPALGATARLVLVYGLLAALGMVVR